MTFSSAHDPGASSPDGVPEWAFLDDDPDIADWAPPVPDDVGLVTEVAGLMAVFAAERLERVDALRCNALAEAGRYGGGVPEVVARSVRLELAAALRVSEHTAGLLLAHAEAMVHRYPAALASLSRAGMTERHAQLLVDLLDAASAPVRTKLTARAVELAEELPVGAFRRALRRLIDTEESATLTQRHEQALTARRVVVEPADDGMAWLHAFLPAVEAHAVHNRLTAMARAMTARPDRAGVDAGVGEAGPPADENAPAVAPDDSRTLDQVRADILGDLLIDGDTAALAPEARGIRATVAVTVPALALLAADDADRHQNGHAPATVEGIGPIPLPTARQLCGGDTQWMRILTHPETGLTLSVGRTQYRPPAALRRLVRWRAEHCMAPGCTVPAHRCEIDHTIDWQHGGDTALTNHAQLCTGHHTIKHHGGWTVSQPPEHGGALLWTSPAGRQYLVHPQRPTPAFHPSDDSAAPF